MKQSRNTNQSRKTIKPKNTGLTNHFFTQIGFMDCDIFLFSNSFQEKLSIIYANLRV